MSFLRADWGHQMYLYTVKIHWASRLLISRQRNDYFLFRNCKGSFGIFLLFLHQIPARCKQSHKAATKLLLHWLLFICNSLSNKICLQVFPNKVKKLLLYKCRISYTQLLHIGFIFCWIVIKFLHFTPVSVHFFFI